MKRILVIISFVIVAIILVVAIIIGDKRYDFTNNTIPHNLSLQIKADGLIYYISQEEWAKVPKKQKEQVEKLGIVVKNNDIEFILGGVNLSDKYLTWNEAMTSYRAQLPDRWQGQVIMDQKNEINDALKNYGLSPMDYCFWTSTERTPDHAEFIRMDNDQDPFGASKKNVYGIRGVKPLAGSESKFKKPKREIIHTSKVRLLNDIYLNDPIGKVGENYDIIRTKDNGVRFSAFGKVPDEITQWVSFPLVADFHIIEKEGKIIGITKTFTYSELRQSKMFEGRPSPKEIFNRLVNIISQRLGTPEQGTYFAGGKMNNGVTWKNEKRDISLLLMCDDPLIIYLSIAESK